MDNLVQQDTLDLRPVLRVLLKHFTAYDVVCKWNVMNVYRQALATTAAHFPDILEARTPFSVRETQPDEARV